MGEIHWVSFGEDLLKRVVEDVKGKDLSAWVFLFPHKRAIYYFRKYLASTLKKPIFAPTLTTLSAFTYHQGLAQLTHFEPAHPLEEALALWEICDLPFVSKETWEDFYPWAVEILSLLEDLTRHGYTPETLKKKLQALDLPPLTQRENFWQTLPDLWQNWQNTLSGWERLPSWEIQLKGLTPLEEDKTYCFVGFFALTPLEAKWLTRQLSQVESHLYLQSDGFPWQGLRWVPSSPPHTLRMAYPQALHLYPHAGITAMMASFRETLLQENFHEGYGVILPHSQQLPSFLQEVAGFIQEPFNITLGYPLKRTALFHYLSTFLPLEEAFSPEGYLSWFTHPYTRSFLQDPSLHQEVFQALKQNLPPSLEALEKQYPALKPLHQELLLPLLSVCDWEVFVQKMKAWLKTVYDKTSFRHYHLKDDLLFALTTCLDEVAGLKGKLPPDTSCLALLLSYFNQWRLPFEGIPIQGLQVMGMLESRLLRFPKLFILEANDDILPSLKSPRPLLPDPIARFLGLPDHRQKEELFHYHFRRLVASAEEVHLFYVESEERSLSRYGEQLIWEMELQGKKEAIQEVNHGFTPPLLKAPKAPVIPKTKKLLDQLQKLIYYPSMLDCYLACPQQFYYAYLVKLQPPEEMAGEALSIGQTLHELLRLTLEPFLKACAEDQKEKIIPHLHQVLQTYLPEKGLYFLLKDIIKKRIEDLIHDDIKEKVIYQALEWTGKLTLPIRGIPIGVTGRLDRLDQRGGLFWVVDYKSTDWGIQVPEEVDGLWQDRQSLRKWIGSFQIPIYLLLAKEAGYQPLGGGFYYDLRKGQYHQVPKKKYDKGNMQNHLDGYKRALIWILEEILDEDIPFLRDDSDPQVCSYCPYATLCRLSS